MKNFSRIATLLAAAFCIAAGAMNASAGTGGDGKVSLNVPFDPDRQSYSATVSNDVTEVTVIARADHPSATVTVNGGDLDTPVPLAVGENVIAVVVTAEDRRTQLTYTVTVTREAAGATADDDANPHAALIAKVRGWRDDPCCAHNPAHTDRWDRVLLALGATVSTTGLTPMGAAEAQTYADRGWTRWVEVAAALKRIENGGTQTPVAQTPVPVVSIAAGAAVTEGAPAGFTLTAAPAPAADLSVSVTVSQSGAFADASALGARTVTIPAGQASAAFAVATMDDALDEPDGSVTAALGSGAGYTAGDAASATVAVADDDEALPGIVTGRTIAREGTDDAAVFTVRLSAAATQTVTVDYATADGAGRWAGTAPARAGADYTAVSGTLTFAAGERSKRVRVPILDDSIDEGTEYFLLRFSNPQGGRLAAEHRETQGPDPELRPAAGDVGSRASGARWPRMRWRR